MTDTVLITGGLGFVGGRLGRYIAAHTDLNVRLSTRRAGAPGPAWLKNGSVVGLDLFTGEGVKAACEGVRYIIHLAAMNEVESVEDPEKAFIINSLGTLKLLGAAEKAGVERFIYFSTAHVYGAPLAGRITELTLPRPAHPYAITHKAAEDFVLASHDRGKITGIVLRLSNGFGAPDDPNVNRWMLLVADLCRQAVTTGRLVLRSSGLQQRDFITLEDVSMATTRFLTLPATSCGDGLFNLGGECAMSVFAMAERISSRCAAILGFTPEIIRPEPKADEISAPLDYRIDKLKSKGFSLAGDIDSELDATLRLCVQAFGHAHGRGEA